jgi:Asp-tRNA(Asn)/Glu-tRNA(Gln) amidotransferase A subunit family amidase
VAAPNFAAAAAHPSPAARLAFVRTPMWERADAEARTALERFVASLDGKAEDEDLPDWFTPGWAAHRVVMSVDMAHRHGELVDRYPEQASEPLRAMVAEGRAHSGVSYLEALALADRMAAALSELLARYDAIITLSAPGIAPKGLGFTGDPVFNALWTLTGLPAVTLPLLRGTDNMPIGVQLVGAHGGDARLMSLAQSFMLDVRR